MPRVVQVPDIRKVDLPEARQAIPHVHAYLRECILDGAGPVTPLSAGEIASWRAGGGELLPRLWQHLRSRQGSSGPGEEQG